MGRIVAAVIVVILAAGCAARPAVPPAPVERMRVDDLVRLIEQGCYRCLTTAVEEAERRGASAYAFEAAALLALRSKELGLPFEAWLAKARAHAATVEAASLYLDVIVSIPAAPLSGNRDLLVEFKARTQARASLDAWRGALKPAPPDSPAAEPGLARVSDVFRAYLDVSLVCAFGRLRQDEESFSAPLDPVARTAIYQYRIGICDSTYAERLMAVRAAEPDLVDADYALGRYALEDPVAPDPEKALRYFEGAAAAFPGSPAIAATIGDVYRGWEDWAPALDAYDAALAVSPDHPEGMLGRTVSLSRLMRSAEAIAAATRMIELGQWRVGEAYYWRAWNYLLLGSYDLARRDADSARTRMANAAMFVLSGTIEWRMMRLDSAEREFQQALTMDLGECEAAFNLGVVRDELGRQDGSLAAFEQARRCYDLSMAVRREAISAIRSGPGTESAKARAAAVHERVLADLEDRHRDALRAIEVLTKVAASR